ncbi:MAG: carboxypeptidase-like regulatory domain-containing protein, partial [bacterium]
MKLPVLKIKVILCSILMLQWSCLSNADRNNPLDAKSEHFTNTGTLTGQILTIYSPFDPLSDVEVRMQPENLVSLTNTQGQFLFENVSVGKHFITANKEGFAVVKDTFNVQLGQTTQVQMQLDGLPFISSFSVNTSHISRWFPGDDFLLEVSAQVNDPDGLSDITLVEVEIPEISFIDTLDITPTPGIYSKRISELQMPNKLQDVLGRQIFINVQDRPGSETVSQPNFIARIIEQTPAFESPSGDILNVAKPLLKWKSITLPFNFT